MSASAAVDKFPAPIPERGLRICVLATSSMALRFLLLGRLICLRNSGFQVRAVCGDERHAREVCDAGIEVDVVPMKREVHPWQDLVSLLALIRYFRRNRYDVLATHTPKAGLIGPLAARVAGIPLVVHTVHGLLFHDQMPFLRREAGRLAERWTGLLADHLLFQSREDLDTAQRMQLKSSGKLHWVGNGIDLTRFELDRYTQARASLRKEYGFDESHLVIGTVGRLVWEKGFREFFAAAESISGGHPNVRFLVVGPSETGDQRDAIDESTLRRVAQRVRIVFAGFRSDMPRAYVAMDLFVLASYREGIPRALMEAMAMGLPVIATHIRGVREVIGDQTSGILVPLRDSAALATAIDSLLRDPGRRTAHGQAARLRAKQFFSEQAVHDRFLAVLRHAGENSPRSRCSKQRSPS